MKAIEAKHLINRELSWLDFNSRVLDQAADATTPILERLKFIAIFSNNLDEFFMVRVAALRHQRQSGQDLRDPLGMTAEEQLAAIRGKVRALITRQYQLFSKAIVPEMAKAGIRLMTYEALSGDERRALDDYFQERVMPVLTPVGVDPSHPFPILSNRAIEIAVTMRVSSRGRYRKGFVEVPPALPRFVPVRNLGPGETRSFVLLEDLIVAHVKDLFAGCEILSAFPFRLTKDMDFAVEEDEAADLLKEMKDKLIAIKRRQTVRLEARVADTRRVSARFLERFNLSPESAYSVAGPLDLARFFEFIPLVDRPGLTDKKIPPLEIPYIRNGESMFEAIRRERELPLFHPFQGFDPVVRFLEEAADDPNVLAIKQTLYRVSGDSPVARALRRAAENGKQVTVIVELKARFDERRNIRWAEILEESGAHVVYGLAGLKVHCKALLVVRREEGRIKRYAHLATGNYNDTTAKIYTDIGVFFDDPELCADVSALFNVMTGFSDPPAWARIAAAPFNLRETFLRLIDREARQSSPRNPGHIIAKMNSLVDTEIIDHLYRAAYAGVRVELIARGICCLKPGVGTRNLSVVSIVDRYLEHSRVYYFANGGQPEYYLSSADWMPRNLDRRVELLFPVENPALRAALDKLLQAQLNDFRKGRRLNSRGRYPKSPSSEDASRSQLRTYDLLSEVFGQGEEDREKLRVMRKA